MNDFIVRPTDAGCDVQAELNESHKTLSGLFEQRAQYLFEIEANRCF